MFVYSVTFSPSEILGGKVDLLQFVLANARTHCWEGGSRFSMKGTRRSDATWIHRAKDGTRRDHPPPLSLHPPPLSLPTPPSSDGAHAAAAGYDATAAAAGDGHDATAAAGHDAAGGHEAAAAAAAGHDSASSLSTHPLLSD
jgi:hypothetical protein